MSLLFPEPKLEPGESVVWSQRANLTVSRSWISGTLFLTNQALRYVPGMLTLAKLIKRDWGLSWDLSVNEVASVSVMERTYTLYDGGVRRRVRIRSTTGEEYLLACPKPDDVAYFLSETLLGREPTPQPLLDDPPTTT